MLFSGDKFSRIAVSLVGVFVLLGASPPTVVDPLFGIRFDPSRVHFAEAPSTLLNACPDLETKRWARKAYLFGRASTPDHETLIIGGYFAEREGKSVTTDKLGAMIVRTRDRCILVGPPAEAIEYVDNVISVDEYRVLIADAGARYRNAFGGSLPLSKALARVPGMCDQHPAELLRNAFGRELSAAAAHCHVGVQ